MGALTGSRASTEPASRLGPSGFDPERFEVVAEGCDNIIKRTQEGAIAFAVCEDVGELERYHDALAHEVINLAGMLQTAAKAIAAGSRRAKTPQAVECEASQSGPKASPNPSSSSQSSTSSGDR